MHWMHLKRLDLNLLLVFDELLASRNLTAAAARLNMTQPTMSHALRRLRSACGDPLFVRTARGMDPTPYALRIAGDVAQAFELIRTTFARNQRFDPATSDRRFRILMADIGEVVFLPRLMSRLKRDAPHMNITTQQIQRDQPDVVRSLASEIAKVTGSPEFRDKYITALSLEPAPPGPEFFATVIQQDREKYGRFVRAANVKLD